MGQGGFRGLRSFGSPGGFRGLGVAGGGGAPVLEMTATTTSPGETVTLQRITPTGANVTVQWGDTTSSTITNGNTGTTTHVYASAGTYAIKITRPSILTYVDLRDTKITAFNSSTLVSCPLTSLYLYLPGAGTCTFNSSHISAMALTYLSLNLPGAGTYTFNSSHISAMALTYLYLNLPVAGTYTFNSSHVAARSTITSITVFLHTTNTITIARADWDGFPACGTVRVEAALAQAQVDNLLLGLWDGFATKTVTGGTVDLLGQSNAAPSGVLHAECPPLDGYAAAYELVNDSCGVSTKHWTSVTTA